MDNRTVMKRFELEIEGVKGWLNELNPFQDGELIAKLEVLLDMLTINFINFLKEENIDWYYNSITR